jgi:hypothetical protein
LAELDFYSAERGGGEWGVESLWNRRAGEIQLGKSLRRGSKEAMTQRDKKKITSKSACATEENRP